MKIRIAFADGEEATVNTALAVLLDNLPPVKIHKNAPKPPYNVIFLTTRKAENPRRSKGSP